MATFFSKLLAFALGLITCAAPLRAQDGPPASGDTPSFSARAKVRVATPHERAVAASDVAIEVGALHDVPRRDAEQYMTLAPGVVLANHAGQGHASSILLRGFDAGEGQDLEVIVDGVPINEPSNAHAHGYADTQFVIPELIERVRVVEGPFDPRQGDFAVAGSALYELGAPERGIRASLGYGSFGEHRALLMWAPTGASKGTFGALDLRDGDGFGPNRAHSSARALGRYAHDDGPLQYSLLAASHALTFDSAGLVRQDAIDRRTLPCATDYDSQRFCTADPNQGGSASRHLVSGRLSWRRPERRAELQAFGMRRTVRVRESFTGALLFPEGDGLDERYEATTLGVRGAMTLLPHAWGRSHRFELGFDARRDDGRTQLWRLRRVTAIPYDTVFDTELGLTHIGGYARAVVGVAPWLTVLGGLRLDAFGFSTLALDEDETDRVGERLPVNARDAWGTALSPRGTLLFHALPWLDWSVSAGIGVRSSDAQALSEGEAAPFARATAFETGSATNAQLSGNTQLETRAFAFSTHVSDDLAFDAERGRNVPLGATNRYGVSASARLRVATVSDSMVSATWSEAHVAPADASLLELDSGPRLPFVPRFVARADQALRLPVRIGGERVTFGAASGISLIGPRPLPLGASTNVFAQLDASLRARVRFVELALSVENLFDTDNDAFAAHYASDFGDPNDDTPASMRAVSHVAAASPRLWMLTLTAYLDDLALISGGDS
jgi:outer membrane receptor protein involved in Fe transport